MPRAGVDLGLLRGEWMLFLLDGVAPHVDVDAMCREVGIPYARLREPLARIPLERATAALARAEGLCGDPLVGLRVAAQPRGTGCVLRYLAISQETLGDALAVLCRYQALILSGHELSLVPSDTGYLLTAWPTLGESSRHIVEAWLAVISREVCHATGRADCIGEIHLRHAAAAPAVHYERTLACRVRFEQPCNAIVFPASVLDTPLVRHNPEMARDLADVAQLELEVQSSESMAQRVALLVGAGLRIQQHCGRGAIAGRLLLTTRTLQRRLDAEGVSFNELADRVRRDLALQLATDPRLDLAAVAQRCGFSSTSAFNKAFKRWTGAPPSAYRREHGGAAGRRGPG